MMMNFWMVMAYEMVSKADEYWFGFILNHMLYVVKDIPFEVMARFFKKDIASQKKGGFQKIRIRARVEDLEGLLPIATLLGGEELLECVKNKGDALEKVLCERFGEGNSTKHDSSKFWVCGDLVINGKQVQVKFNGAELTNERVFKNNFPELVPN